MLTHFTNGLRVGMAVAIRKTNHTGTIIGGGKMATVKCKDGEKRRVDWYRLTPLGTNARKLAWKNQSPSQIYWTLRQQLTSLEEPFPIYAVPVDLRADRELRVSDETDALCTIMHADAFGSPCMHRLYIPSHADEPWLRPRFDETRRLFERNLPQRVKSAIEKAAPRGTVLSVRGAKLASAAFYLSGVKVRRIHSVVCLDEAFMAVVQLIDDFKLANKQ